MNKNSSELDRIVAQGISSAEHAPQHPMSEAQIAAAAASTSGAGVWLLAHAREILLCAVSLAIGVGGTLLVMHLLGSRNTVPTETAAAIATDTTGTTGTTMVAEDTVAFTGKTTVDAVETQCIASLQTDLKTVSAKPTSNVSSPKSHVSHSTSPVSTPVIVKKTVVQRDTVVLNETVILKDTVYVP